MPTARLALKPPGCKFGVDQACELWAQETPEISGLRLIAPCLSASKSKLAKATKPGVIGLAVSDVVAELSPQSDSDPSASSCFTPRLPDVPAGPSIDEDPLSEEHELFPVNLANNFESVA